MRFAGSHSAGAWILAGILVSATGLRVAVAGTEMPGDVPAARVEDWLQPGREAASRGDYEAARRLTALSLTEAQNQVLAAHWSLAYLLNDLSRWEARLGAHTESLGHAEEALLIAREAFGVDPARVAYFANDVGVLRFRHGDCAGAESVLAASFNSMAGLPALEMRARVGNSYARVLWGTGDTARAADVAQSLTTNSQARVADALLLLAQLDIDDRRLGPAREKLDRYRDVEHLKPGEDTWHGLYLEAELAYALAAGDLQAAYRLVQHLLSSTSESSDAQAKGAAQHRLGQVLSLLGRFGEAERAFSEALRLVDSSGSATDPAVSPIYHDMAWTYRLVGDYPRSEFYFDQALSSSRTCSAASDSMPVLMLREQALLRLERGEITKALQGVSQAEARVAEVRGDTRMLRGLLSATRAFALDRIGDAGGSREAMQKALTLISEAEGPDSINLPLGQVHLADLDYRSGRFSQALVEANAALTILEKRQTRSVWGAGASLSLRGAASARSGNDEAYWADAERFAQIAESALAPSDGASTFSQSEVAQARKQSERLLDALPEVDGKRLAVVGRLMQLPHISDATASLLVAALESLNLPKSVANLVKQRGQLLEEAQALRSTLLLAQQRGQRIDAGTIGRLNGALDRLTDVDRKLLAASPSIAGQFLQRAAPLDEVQRALRENEAALLQVVSGDAMHWLYIDRKSVSYRSVAITKDQVRQHVRQLRRALDLALPEAEQLPFNAATAALLYKNSFGLFEAELADKEHLVVVADDALQSLPLSVLVREVGADGHADSFVIDKWAVTTVPSLQSFLALRRTVPAMGSSRPYIAFADPVMEGFQGAPQGRRGSPEHLAAAAIGALPALPEAADEVRRIAATLGGEQEQVYVGDRATEAVLKALDLRPFRIISFATHGLMAGQVPGLSEPALVLTRPSKITDTGDDGLLVASEVARLSLRAELVILSACNTGRVNSRVGITGISGLARGFFAAGAQSLLVSHWAVASEATVQLLAKTAEGVTNTRGNGRAEALRAAMLWMKNGGAGAEYKDPAFWGAFSLVGETGGSQR